MRRRRPPFLFWREGDMTLNERIQPLFAGWQEALIWSCLQGCMGSAAADDPVQPQSARITVGDFCFFAGKPDAALILDAAAPILVPRSADWETAIERVCGDGVVKRSRYAIKKEPEALQPHRLERFADALAPGYRLAPFDAQIYAMAMAQAWSRDFCALFADAADYLRRGVGVAVLQDGALVAGASSYAVYRGGIEIEIDTRADHRRRGLATACGAALMLACLRRGLYPSWDAHDLRSAALAEKLGDHVDAPYTTYDRRV